MDVHYEELVVNLEGVGVTLVKRRRLSATDKEAPPSLLGFAAIQ